MRKRQYRISLREKKRKNTFVSRYLELNRPSIYAEIVDKYKALAEQYPGRADLTKTYLFKKWEAEVKNAPKQRLYVPHLPILANIPIVRSERVEIIEESPQSPPQRPPQQPQEAQEPPQRPPQQPQEAQEPPQRPSQEPQEPPQRPPQQPQEPQESPQTFYSGMSLDQMEIASEEIVRELQSDKELMDIVEGLDLPQAVWDNELSIPDYVLDDELQW